MIWHFSKKILKIAYEIIEERKELNIANDRPQM